VWVSSFFYICWLLSSIANHGYSMFSVFLLIPTGCLRALAAKQIYIHSGDSEDGDAEYAAESGTFATKVRELDLWQ
jgi:hypothetical protein